MTTTRITGCDSCGAPDTSEYHLVVHDPDAERDGGRRTFSIDEMLCDPCAADALLDDLVLHIGRP